MYIPLISVIIPFYNRINTLPTCIDSVLKANYNNLEILLIDDGSNDGSSEIAQQYALRNHNVNYISQRNSGVSSARNAGIENANGQWITFIDSDDAIKPNHFDIVVNEGHDADLLMTGSGRCTIPDYLKIDSRFGLKISHPIANQYLLSKRFNPFGNVFYSVWDKFFRMELINEYSMRFDTTMSLGEDQVFVCEYLKVAGKFVRYTNPTYISLSWDFHMDRLGKKFRSPSDYLYNEIKGYESLMRLSKFTKNKYAERYAVNFGINRPVEKILYGFATKENRRTISMDDHLFFLSKKVIPFLKSINTSHHNARNIDIRFSNFLLKNFGAKAAMSWAALWVNHLRRPVHKLMGALAIPRNYIRYRLTLRRHNMQHL